MSDSLHQPPAEIVARALVNPDQYAEMYAASVADPEAFWGEQGKRLDWIEPYTRVKNTSFDHARRLDQMVRGRQAQRRGQLHRPPPRPPRRPDRDHLGERRPRRLEHISYRELHAEVSKFANVLHALGVRKGDRVVLYLPMIPEAAYAMLACARIGAVHSVVFAGFSAEALRSRVEDSGAKLVVTADEAPRGGRRTPLKANADKALGRARRRAPARRPPHRRRGALGRGPRRLARRGDGDASPTHCAPVAMAAEDPLFILYTSRLDRPAQGGGAHHRRLSPLLPR